MPLSSILLVEDSPEDVELTRLALSRAGFRHPLVVAADGAAALDRLVGGEAPGPALVLLDLKLPRVDGITVLRELRLRDRTRLVPVVVLTSSAAERDVQDAYAAGANGYVVKPLDFHTFRETVADILGAWLGVPRSTSEALPGRIHGAARGEDVLVALADARERELAAAIFARTTEGAVHRAGSVAAACQVVAAEREHLGHILVDAHLPDGAGTEVVKAMRSACGHRVTAAMLAREPSDAEVRACLEATANAVAREPRDPAALEALFTALARFWLGWNRTPSVGSPSVGSDNGVAIKPAGPR